MKLRFQDEEGRLIEVGTPVRYFFGPSGSRRATAVAFGEPDADYDDELGRAVEYPPSITIRFDGSDETEEVRTWNITKLTWGDYPDGPEELVYEACDVEVITP